MQALKFPPNNGVLPSRLTFANRNCKIWKTPSTSLENNMQKRWCASIHIPNLDNKCGHWQHGKKYLKYRIADSSTNKGGWQQTRWNWKRWHKCDASLAMQPNHVRFMAFFLKNPFARPTTLMKLVAVRFHLSRSQFVHIYCPLDGPRTTPSRKSQRVSVSIQPCRYVWKHGCLAKKSLEVMIRGYVSILVSHFITRHPGKSTNISGACILFGTLPVTQAELT